MGIAVIDVSALRGTTWRDPHREVPAEVRDIAARIDTACRTHGFFSVVGHGVDTELFSTLALRSREFFDLPEGEKARIAMAVGGRAWRGWFPLGGELTAGVPDHKEGLYFGSELDPSDPRVVAGLPLHGANLFPEQPGGMRPVVLELIDVLTDLGQALVGAMGIGLGLGPHYFAEHLTADPTVLLRVFRYPALREQAGWGVSEHTDYGLLTLLHQDDTGGLQVRDHDSWVDIDPIPGALVCNLGDMLERMTGGRYRATAHRVRVPDRDRMSIPFFFDPSWDAEITELPLVDPPVGGAPATEPAAEATQRETDPPSRWDGTDLRTLSGTYGDYLAGKVSKVFPELWSNLVDDH